MATVLPRCFEDAGSLGDAFLKGLHCTSRYTFHDHTAAMSMATWRDLYKMHRCKQQMFRFTEDALLEREGKQLKQVTTVSVSHKC